MPDNTPKSHPSLPLFLLNTVLMPGGLLPLRVFEPRYVDMVARCMHAATPFGVVAIERGAEVGAAAAPHRIGTLARITDFDQGQDGLLQIVAVGEQRFQLLQHEVRPDRLTEAKVELIPDDQATPVPAGMDYLAEGLERVLDQAGPPFSDLPRSAWDAVWVSNRLTELLPLPLPKKQGLLATLDPVRRLDDIGTWIRSQR